MVKVARLYEKIKLALSVKEAVNNCKIFINDLIEKNISIYGVNTGFKDLVNVFIS